jgi:hypothetical protein
VLQKSSGEKHTPGFEQDQEEVLTGGKGGNRGSSLTSFRSHQTCLEWPEMHPDFRKAAGLTAIIIGAAIEVHRDKGPGLIESIYEWCFEKELEIIKVPFYHAKASYCSLTSTN